MFFRVPALVWRWARDLAPGSVTRGKNHNFMVLTPKASIHNSYGQPCSAILPLIFGPVSFLWHHHLEPRPLPVFAGLLNIDPGQVQDLAD